MKFRNNKTLKIAAATTVTLFSLVAVFAATIAWFAMNTDVTAKGQGITVKIVNANFSKMTIHKYLGTTTKNEVDYYQFNQTASATFTYNVATQSTTYTVTDPSQAEDASFMGEYSPDNPRHPLLALIEFDSVLTTGTISSNVCVDVSTTKNFLCDTDDTGAFKEPLNEANNPLSSVVQFYTECSASMSAYSNGTTSYDYAVPASSSFKHFANIDVNQTTGDLTYVNNSWVKSLNLANVSDGTQVKYVAIIIDYYENAFEYIFNRYLGNEYLEQEHVTFWCDWKLVI